MLPKRAKTTIAITAVNNKGPKSEIVLTSNPLLVVDPTSGKKPYKPGRENTEYKIAEKNQLSEAFKISKLLTKVIPAFKVDESLNKLIIACDGESASGKSTAAKLISQKYNLIINGKQCIVVK